MDVWRLLRSFEAVANARVSLHIITVFHSLMMSLQ